MGLTGGIEASRAGVPATADWRELRERLGCLRRSGLFRGLPQPVLRELAACAERVRVSAGGVVCTEGAAAHRLYLPISGEVMPMLCFPRVLFCGAILPVPAMATPGAVISYVLSNRWAFEGIGHTAGLERLWRGGGSPLGPPLLASFGDSFARPVGAGWAILAAFAVASILATCAVLDRRDAAR